jgi:hypothetical protein
VIGFWWGYLAIYDAKFKWGEWGGIEAIAAFGGDPCLLLFPAEKPENRRQGLTFPQNGK